MMKASRFLVLLVCAALETLACKSTQAPQAVAGPEKSEVADEPSVSIVESAVVVSECPDAKLMSVRAARSAIRHLVDPCASVPGGSSHFAATLLPDGRIELAAPSGDINSGVVPTCVLKNKLTHHVTLRTACKFDVTLDERK